MIDVRALLAVTAALAETAGQHAQTVTIHGAEVRPSVIDVPAFVLVFRLAREWVECIAHLHH